MLLLLHFMCSKSRFWKRIWRPFADLINSKAFRIVWKRLILSDLQHVAKTQFKKSICLLPDAMLACKCHSSNRLRSWVRWNVGFHRHWNQSRSWPMSADQHLGWSRCCSTPVLFFQAIRWSSFEAWSAVATALKWSSHTTSLPHSCPCPAADQSQGT